MGKRKQPDQELRVLRFVNAVANKSNGTQLYAAIDPGAEAAIGFVCGVLSTVVDVPTQKVRRGKGKTKTVFDLDGILSLFDCLCGFRFTPFFLVEEPPPSMGQGKGSPYGQFRLGCAFAMWPLFLRSRGYRVETTMPSVWKRKMGLTPDKNRSLSAARKLFPSCSKLLARKKDHNRSEALLLAEYCRRYLK